MGLEVVIGTNGSQALASRTPGRVLRLPFESPEAAIRQVRALDPFVATVGVDEESTLLAARIAEALGLPHNPVESMLAAGNKLRLREMLVRAGVPSPEWQVFRLDEDPRALSARVPFPCVLKPLVLSASRGVMRADDPDGFVRAHGRLARILSGPDLPEREPDALSRFLVERFVPGPEVAVEGLLERGRLHVLALFDKPDPLDGPFFEETIYVTPSRLPEASREAIARTTELATRAMGLTTGPIHAELRLPSPEAPVVIEVAARTIGGLCGRTLRFGTGLSLEEVVLAQASGREPGSLVRETAAAGVLMLPIPRGGVLREVRGLEAARAVPGVEEVEITMHVGQEVVPLPEGARYPGFVFARGASPAEVESALRSAGAAIELGIESSLRFRAATNADGPAIRGVVHGVLREFALTPEPGGTDADIEDVERHYLEPGGAFEVVVDAGGRVVGTAGFVPLTGAACELRKMYLLPEARGRGLGRRLLDHVVDLARARGFVEMRLETASVLADAIRLYVRYGFERYTSEHMVPRCDQAFRLDLRR